eukprot:gene26997-32617_t
MGETKACQQFVSQWHFPVEAEGTNTIFSAAPAARSYEYHFL